MRVSKGLLSMAVAILLGIGTLQGDTSETFAISNNTLIGNGAALSPCQGKDCAFIRDDDLKNYCRGDCSFIKNADFKSFCRSDCAFIRNGDLKNKPQRLQPSKTTT